MGYNDIDKQTERMKHKQEFEKKVADCIEDDARLWAFWLTYTYKRKLELENELEEVNMKYNVLSEYGFNNFYDEVKD